MKDLLLAIKAQIETAIPYFSWVGVIEDETMPPEGPKPPFCAIRDGGLTAQAIPSNKEDERLTVLVVPYVALFATPGAAIMGESSLGDEGKGLIEIGDDLYTALNGKTFGLCIKGHRDRIDRSRTLDLSPQGGGPYLQFQLHHFTFWRTR